MNLQGVVFESLDLRVDTGAYRVEVGGSPVTLEPKAFDLLVFLLSNAGQLVTKQQLLDAVWAETAVTENALTRVIAQLRKGLGDDAREARFLETVPTRGYRWIAPVTRGSDRGRTGVGPGSEYEYGATQGVDSRRRMIATRTILLPALLAAVITIGWLAIPRTTDEPRPLFPLQLTTGAGVDLFPALSPDGQRLAYTSDRTGAWEIYVRPTNGGGSDAALTHDGRQNVQPAWSPDGRSIAFHSMARGGIWIAPAAGGPARQLSEFGARPAWSPDGRRLAFQSGASADIAPASRPANLPSTIWTVDVAGGQPRPLTRRGVPIGGHGAPAWSPDGRQVVFASAGFARAGIWAIDVEGGEPFAIADGLAEAYDPVYLPGSRAVIFATPRMLWRVPLDARGRPAGAAARYVPASLQGIRHLTIARDGRIAVAALTLDSGLWSVAVDADGTASGAARPLTNDTRQRNSRPTFSPDGRRIAVMSSTTGHAPDVWMMNADGTGLEQLTTAPEFESDPRWSPDGREVIFKSLRSQTAGLWAIDVETRRERQIARFGSIDEIVRQQGLIEELAVSPDATRIAYTVLEPRTSTKALYVRRIAGGEPERLTTGDPLTGYPAWSPDGRWIALEVFEPGRTDLALVPSDGGPLYRLHSEGGHSWVHGFSPDGERLVFAGQRNGIWNIYWIPRGGGEEHAVTSNTDVGVFVRYPSWSPRGDQIVFEHGAVRGNVWIMQAPGLQ